MLDIKIPDWLYFAAFCSCLLFGVALAGGLELRGIAHAAFGAALLLLVACKPVDELEQLDD